MDKSAHCESQGMAFGSLRSNNVLRVRRKSIFTTLVLGVVGGYLVDSFLEWTERYTQCPGLKPGSFRRAWRYDIMWNALYETCHCYYTVAHIVGIHFSYLCSWNECDNIVVFLIYSQRLYPLRMFLMNLLGNSVCCVLILLLSSS